MSCNKKPRAHWAIIGAGNGGQAFAAYLSLQGVDITIYDNFQSTVDAINEQGGVYLEGNCKHTGFGAVRFADTDIARVMDGASVILVILPSIYHNDIAAKMAPHLKDGQIVVLNPITPLGTMDFRNTLEKANCKADIVLAGTNTLLFACRLAEQGRAVVGGQKNEILVAAYPASDNDTVGRALSPYLPEYKLVPDILTVTFDNLNFEFHPGPTLLYSAMIEGGREFEYYSDFVPSQVTLIEAIDKERLQLCHIYGVKARDVTQTFHDEYGYEGDLYEQITKADVYKGIKGPTSMNNRMVTEDIPYSLVALQSLAKIAHLKTPAIDTVVNLGYILLGNQLDEGRTVENLGLTDRVTVNDVISMCRGA